MNISEVTGEFLVYDGNLIVPHEGGVTVYDVCDHSSVRSIQSGEGHLSTPPAVLDGDVYFGTDEGQVVKAPIASDGVDQPVYGGLPEGVVSVVPTSDGVFVRTDPDGPQNERTIVRFSTEVTVEEQKTFSPMMGETVYEDLAVSGEDLLIPTSDEVICLDATSLEEKWDTERLNRSNDTVVVVGDRLFRPGHTLYTIDASTGGVLYEYS